MKKVLVVGANSYIGKKFKEYVELSNNDEVVVDMVSASNGSWRKVEFSNYDVVLHLAAIVHRKEKRNMEKLYYRVNHQLAVDVAIKAKQNKVRQFIFMSTAAVYGNVNGYVTKETLPNPRTYYGKSKYAAEMDLNNLSDDEYLLCIVRPPMVYGDGCRGNYAILRKVARYLMVFPDYRNKKSIVGINFLASYLVRLIINENRGVFLPHDAKPVSTVELLIDFRKGINKETRLFKGLNLVIKKLVLNNKLTNIFGDFYYKI